LRLDEQQKAVLSAYIEQKVNGSASSIEAQASA
jgi:hypothetical protein